MTDSRPSQAGGDSDSGGELPYSAAHPRRDWHERDFSPPVPEALAAPAIVWARHAEVLGDPFNIRDSLPSIPRLAWSIYQYGLLENLLVVELSDEKKALHPGKRFELRAGSRRFEAIRRLIDGLEPPSGHPDRELGLTWYWPSDRPLPLLVLGSEGHYEHLLENIERSDPLPWEVGRRIDEVLSANVTARELGLRLGRSNGWVTRYAHIGRGLSPELIEILRKERAEVRLGELAQLSAIRDQFGDPDGPAQIEAYRARRQKRRRRPRRVDPHSFRATLKRLQYLRADMPVPALIRPIVETIIEYLEGGTRPQFRELETRLFDQLKTFSPDVETEEA